jgi:hypothetical protein
LQTTNNPSSDRSSTTAHTDGPWIVEADYGSPSKTLVYSAGGRNIADCMAGLPAEDEANARLIAAAPDSHEANRMFVRAVYVAHNIPSDASDEFIYDTIGTAMADAFFAARAAIAKATA